MSDSENSGSEREPITSKEIYDDGKQLLQPDTCPNCGGENVEATFGDEAHHLVDYDCLDCGAGTRIPYYEHVMFVGAVEQSLHTGSSHEGGDH